MEAVIVGLACSLIVSFVAAVVWVSALDRADARRRRGCYRKGDRW